MSVFIFKLMDHTRRMRKRIKCNGTVQDLILEAHKMGFSGQRIMDPEGFQIEDDEDLRSNTEHQLTILANEKWEDEVLTHKESTNFEILSVDPVPGTSGLSAIRLNHDFKHQVGVETIHIDNVTTSSADTEADVEVNSDTIATDTMESIVMISEDAPTSSSDAELFSNFVIPWSKLPSELNESLKNKKYLNKTEMGVVANLFVKELQHIHPRVPASVLERVSTETAQSYPDSFIKNDEFGQRLSVKPVLLLAKMTAIRNYKNRKPNIVKHTGQTIQKSVNDAKEMKKISETVLNWQPNIVGKENELKKLKEWLRATYTSDEKDLLTSEITQAMSDTFGLQRLNINKDSKVEHTFTEWPFLAEMRHLGIHFKLLTGVELENFEYYFKKYKGFLLPILEKCNNKEIAKVLEATKTNPIEIDARAMKLLAAYFKEDYHSLVVDYPLGTSLEEMSAKIELETPFIGRVETPNGTSYYVYVDKERVADCTTFSNAFSTMLAMYYVFNIMYPKKASLTLEFIQRQFLRIRMPVVRGKKGSSTSMSAVFTLMVLVNEAMEDDAENKLAEI